MPITNLDKTTYARLDFARRAHTHFAEHPGDTTFSDAAAGGPPIAGETLALRVPTRDGRGARVLVFELPHDTTGFEDLEAEPVGTESATSATSDIDLPPLPPRKTLTKISGICTRGGAISHQINFDSSVILDGIQMPSDEAWNLWKLVEMTIVKQHYTVGLKLLRITIGLETPGLRRIYPRETAPIDGRRILLLPGDSIRLAFKYVGNDDVEHLSAEVVFLPSPVQA